MKNVFLIASSSLLANKVIPALERDGGVALTVLLHSEEARERIALDHDTKVIVVPNGKGYRIRALISFFVQMKGKTFDEVVVLYNNKTGYGYLNVDLYALVLNASKRYACNYDHDEILLTLPYIARKVNSALIGLWWYVVNTIFLSVILSLIFISMLVVEVLVWVKRILSKKETPI